jgi:hypothetical protein
MQGQVARVVVARYAFKGPGVEMEQTLPLRPGEEPILAGRITSRYEGHSLGYRRGFLRLSTDRLCILQVFAFRKDRIIEVPREAVLDVAAEKPPLRIRFRGSEAEEELRLGTAARLGRTDARGGLKKTVVDTVAFQRGGEAESLREIGRQLSKWIGRG